MDVTPVMAALGSLVLERTPDGRFVHQGQPPDWCATLGSRALSAREPIWIQDVFPFLEIFVPDAERVWRADSTEVQCSDFWTEKGANDEEVHLEACALRVHARPLLIITRNEKLFSQKELVLQRARELRLAHRELTRQAELKDILVHSIVHDLASPLHGILGSLSLLTELPLSAEASQWTDLALQAARRQKALVADILDVFSAEHGAFTAAPNPTKAPDLALAISDIVAQTEPAARINEKTITWSMTGGPLRVVAEETRLTRVLANLVENALRYTPPGGRIVVSTHEEDDAVRVNVDDDGPGVPRDVLPHLFELFAGKQLGVAGTGLGLYFCRITVERWGGGIGYERRPEGGSRFWIRLLRATPGKRHG